MNLKGLLKKYRNNSRKGYTLVELMAVVAIVAILSGASLSIFVAVGQSTRDLGNTAAEQYSTAQAERFLRNEFQVASNVDVLDLTTSGSSKVPNFAGASPYGSTYAVQEDDEFLYFNDGRLYFMKADESKTFKNVLTIDDVEEVTIDIYPIDYAKAEAGGASAKDLQLKMVYNIKTTEFVYSSGIILGNTKTGRGKNMAWADSTNYMANLNWKSGSSDNTSCIFFHSETTRQEDPTPP